MVMGLTKSARNHLTNQYKEVLVEYCCTLKDLFVKLSEDKCQISSDGKVENSRPGRPILGKSRPGESSSSWPEDQPGCQKPHGSI